MNAKPVRRLTGLDADFKGIYDGDIEWIPMQGGTKEGFAVKCEILHPPSSKGKTLHVFFDARDVTDMLRLCRDSAIERRKEPLKWEDHRS